MHLEIYLDYSKYVYDMNITRFPYPLLVWKNQWKGSNIIQIYWGWNAYSQIKRVFHIILSRNMLFKRVVHSFRKIRRKAKVKQIIYVPWLEHQFFKAIIKLLNNKRDCSTKSFTIMPEVGKIWYRMEYPFQWVKCLFQVEEYKKIYWLKLTEVDLHFRKSKFLLRKTCSRNKNTSSSDDLQHIKRSHSSLNPYYLSTLNNL